MKRFPRSFAKPLIAALLLPLLSPFACAQAQTQTPAPVALPQKAPFRYVWGKAHHILPETHTDESGYFSIVEGKDGKIYVGTAKYDFNAFVVEFDPQTETQKIVIDTNQVNGLTATGFASQSKIHTRNFVGPSGTVYVGSQEGYRRIKGDTAEYPGGYVMAYDPQTGRARSMGMPMKGEGVIDVVADEARGLLYVVTSWGEDGKAHWMMSDILGKSWREIGGAPVNYGSTLLDKEGRAHTLSADGNLLSFDPKTRTLATREISIKDHKGAPPRIRIKDIPTWQLTPDRRSAYVIYMGDPTLLQIDLGGFEKAKGRVLGQMLEGTGYDSRSSLTVAPDGRVYALVKVHNATKFGGGNLHHLTRYDPKKKKTEDLGVLAVKNPDFFDFGPRADGKRPPWSHGYHTLPDGTMTPLHGHQGLVAAKDGGLYALILYPYTLLHIPAESIGVKPIAAKVAAQTTTKLAPALKPIATNEVAPYSRQFNAFTMSAIDRVEKNLPEIQRVAEIMAQRHFEGGLFGFPWNGQSLQQELAGRSGGMMNISFDRGWKGRSPELDKHNGAIIGWDRAPRGGELARIQALKEKGVYIVGFGPRDLPELKEIAEQCDAFFDTGLGADDRVVTLPNGKAGRANALVNMLNGWAVTGEMVAALTRKGVMPLMWKGWLTADGRDWSNKYFGTTQWHDDFKIAPIAAGTLSRAYFDEIRANIRRFEANQSAKVVQAAQLIVAESVAGRKTLVASQGHAPWTYVGKYEDARWGTLFDVDAVAPQQVEGYRKNAPKGALVLRLGYSGLNEKDAALFKEKNQRVMLITVPTPVAGFQPPADLLLNIDMEWPHGDAAIEIPGYPIKVLPPSGIMQIIAYEGINVETLARLPAVK